MGRPRSTEFVSYQIGTGVVPLLGMGNWWENAKSFVVIMQGDPDLFELVQTLDPPSRHASRLHRRQKQRDKNDDCDQQIN